MPDPDSPANISSGTDCLPRGITEKKVEKHGGKYYPIVLRQHSFFNPLNRDDTTCNAESTASVLSGVPSI